MNEKWERIWTENQIATEVVEAACRIHTVLGPGLAETVYEVAMTHELVQRGLRFVRQSPIPLGNNWIPCDEGFRADLIIEGKVILELKSVEQLAPVHHKQLLTYLRLADKRLGLLVNFGQETAGEGLKQIVKGVQQEPR